MFVGINIHRGLNAIKALRRTAPLETDLLTQEKNLTGLLSFALTPLGMVVGSLLFPGAGPSQGVRNNLCRS